MPVRKADFGAGVRRRPRVWSKKPQKRKTPANPPAAASFHFQAFRAPVLSGARPSGLVVPRRGSGFCPARRGEPRRIAANITNSTAASENLTARNSNGEISRSAALTSTNVAPQISAFQISAASALRLFTGAARRFRAVHQKQEREKHAFQA